MSEPGFLPASYPHRQLRFSEAFRSKVNDSKDGLTAAACGRNATFCAQRSHLASNPLRVFVRIRPAVVKSVVDKGSDLFVQAASDIVLNMYPPNKDKRWVGCHWGEVA